MPECYDEEIKPETVRHAEKFSHINISKNDVNLLRIIQQIYDEFRPDTIISVNTFPSYITSQIAFTVPWWADLNGWIMAEAQAQAYKMNSNDYLGHYYQMERAVLARADKFSTVSEAQRFAVLGELAGMGRLNKENFGYEFVRSIPNGIEQSEATEGSGAHYADNIPEDAFVALWMGGYNTWVDEDTLYNGVTAAMRECEKLYFVSTGGEIPGLGGETFAKFKEMIEGSEFKERFVFLGWVATKDIPYIYRRADFGLNVDRQCVETLTGARNRINEMMKFGVPVVTTLGSEISYEVLRVGAGMAVESGKSEDLADMICVLYKEWNGGHDRRTQKFKKFGENGRLYVKNECNYSATQKTVLKWLKNLRPAPDINVSVNLSGGTGLKAAFRYLRENGIVKFFKKLWQRIIISSLNH